MPVQFRTLNLCLASAAALALAACATGTVTELDAPAAAEPQVAALMPAPPPPAINGAPAGIYRLDKTHASLVFTVNHLGFSNYTASFTEFDATLTIDPNAPENATLTATVNPASLSIPSPPEGFLAELIGPNWLNTAAFPAITFASTAVERTGPSEAVVIGDLTFLGATAPIRFGVTLNGAYPGFAPYDPQARAGFSATGAFARSEFGFVQGLPPEGTKMGVGDTVTFSIEAEFTGPPLAADPA